MRKAIWTYGTAACLAAAAIALPATGAQAQELGQYLFQKLLGQDDSPAINYSERANLVLPPSNDLPPPASKQALNEDPNWPKDPDNEKARKASEDSVGPASSNSELLTRDQLATGSTPPARITKSNSQTEMESHRASNPVNPKVLARRGSFTKSAEPLDPTVCPQRRTLVDPPACINKPLASAPLDGNEPLPSEAEAEANKPWYQKVWKFGGGD
jgi:hypothetical protein